MGRLSFGQRTKIALAALRGKSARTYDLTSLWLHGELDMEDVNADPLVLSAFESCAIAYACIRRMYQDAAGVPIVYLREPDNYEEEVGPDDPVRRLLERPNRAMTRRRLIAWTVMMRSLRGECFWTFDNPHRPSEVYPWFDPRGFKELTDRDGLYGWEFRRGNTEFTRAAREVLWTGEENPANPYRGLSPLQAAGRALAIDQYGDNLTASTLRKGGERGMVLHTDRDLTDEQAEQLRAKIARRRAGEGTVSKDLILSHGLDVLDPKFTREDLDILALQNGAKDKICHVYGMAPVIIGDDDAAQFKSAPEAFKAYWNQTLVPLLHSLEDSFDRFFVHDHGLRTFVRFDLSTVAALQEDEQKRARTAKIYADMGIPLSAINGKLGLGFDDGDLAVAEALNALAAMAGPELGGEAPEADKRYRATSPRLTNEVIRARHHDARFKTARTRRRASLERRAWDGLRSVAGDYQKRSLDAIRSALEARGMTDEAARQAAREMSDMAGGFGADLAKAMEGVHRESAQLGVASIQELVDGKHLAWHDRVKAISFSPEVELIMRRRTSYIRQQLAPALIDTMNDLVHTVVREAGEAGESVGWVVGKIREAWGAWSRRHATTIARTEVGTMYNTARYEEMQGQQFEWHEWVTSLDEMTRDGTDSEYDHYGADGEKRRVGDEFSTQLLHPQMDGGDPGNVINCRCETIPYVPED